MEPHSCNFVILGSPAASGSLDLTSGKPTNKHNTTTEYNKLTNKDTKQPRTNMTINNPQTNKKHCLEQQQNQAIYE